MNSNSSVLRPVKNNNNNNKTNKQTNIQDIKTTCVFFNIK